jgi:hypothetical protein
VLEESLLPFIISLILLSYDSESFLPLDRLTSNPKGAPGRIASGVFYEVSLALVGVWPPRLDSNIRISRFKKQQFFVEKP